MQTITAKSLLLQPLSSQIKSLGGEGFNCSVKSTPVDNSFSVIHSFSTPDGTKHLRTLNEFMVGIISYEKRHFVYYDADSNAYTLRTPSDYGYINGKTVQIDTLGSDYDEMVKKLKKLWPNRVVWNLEKPRLFAPA